ncbi:MAG: MFS transporter [Actinomycetes bacterium]
MTGVPGSATAPAALELRRAALGTAAVFALNGFLMAAWISRLPATRDRLHADPASLGLALLMTGVGSLLAMPTTGRLCARYGSRRVVAATLVPSCVALVALAFLPTVWAMAAGLFVLGAGYGSWDVAMNVQASQVDRHAGRDLMPRYHGCWSVGAFVGAALGTLAAAAGVPLAVHFTTDAVVVAVGVTVALRWFLADPPPERASADARRAGRPHAFITRTLVLIGVVTLCATCIEGAAADWFALYLHDGRGTDAGLAAAGYAVFAVAMAASRFSGTTVIDRIGRVAAVRWGGALAGFGVLAAVLAPGVPGAMVGALLWGFGVAVIFPAAMSAGGEVPGHAAQGIATVATIGYGGFLLGPPLIGLLAQHLGLGSALLVLPVLAVGIVVLAPAVRAPHPPALTSPR